MPDLTRRHLLAGSGALAAAAAVSAATQPGMKSLAGKSFLITGTSSGFGNLGALLYARQGARVFATMRNLPRPECGVVLVGFASKGTLARQLVDGASEVQIFGERVPVRASVHTINGFSAHAGRSSLVAWRQKIAAPRTFLVHGELTAMNALKGALPGEVSLPKIGEAAII